MKLKIPKTEKKLKNKNSIKKNGAGAEIRTRVTGSTVL